MANPLNANVGNVPAFQDNRQLVQDGSAQIDRQEDLRLARRDLERDLKKTESGANLALQLGLYGIHLGEQKAIADFYGTAGSEAEAIAQIQSQGGNVATTMNTLTSLAQHRNNGNISYEDAQVRMQNLMRTAKHDNPLFAHVIDKATKQYVTGTPSAGVSGTLTQLSALEEADKAHLINVREKMNLGYSAEQSQAILLNDEQSRIEMQGYDLQVKRNGVNSELLDNMFNVNMQVSKNQMSQRLVELHNTFQNGMDEGTQQAFFAELQNWEIQQRNAIQETITNARESDPTFIMDTKILDQWDKELQFTVEAFTSMAKDADFTTTMEEILKGRDAVTQLYMIEHHKEYANLRGIFGSQTPEILAAMGSNPELLAVFKQSPVLKSLLEDTNLNTSGGVQAVYMDALAGLSSTTYVPGTQSVNLDTTPTDESIAVLVTSILYEPEIADAMVDELINTESEVFNNLVIAAKADSDNLIILDDPAFVQKGQEPEYATKYIKPIVDSGLEGVTSDVLADLGTGSPQLDPLFGGDPLRGYRVEIPGVDSDTERKINEQYQHLMNYPAIIGVDNGADAPARAIAAQAYLMDSLSVLFRKSDVPFEGLTTGSFASEDDTNAYLRTLHTGNPDHFDVAKGTKGSTVDDLIAIKVSMQESIKRAQNGGYTYKDYPSWTSDMQTQNFIESMQLNIKYINRQLENQ